MILKQQHGGFKCEATVTIPPAVVFDSCSKCENKPVRVDVVYPVGILKNQNGGVVKFQWMGYNPSRLRSLL
jgi:hypothetical protein